MLHILLDVAQGTDITSSIISLLREHYALAVLAVGLIIILKYAGDIGLFFKEYFNKKQANEEKKIEESIKNSNRQMIICEDMTKAVNNNTLALNSMEKVFITSITTSEGRTFDKIAGVENRLSDKISGAENRLSEKIITSAKEVVQTTKLDKIVSGLYLPEGRSTPSESTKFYPQPQSRITLPSAISEDQYDGDDK